MSGATANQRQYASDLAVKKTKEFKELKELAVSAGVTDGETAKNATSASELMNALDQWQISRLIEALIAKDEPIRGNRYTDRRLKEMITTLDDIKAKIADWGF